MKSYVAPCKIVGVADPNLFQSFFTPKPLAGSMVFLIDIYLKMT
jgi:hypothetical protein